jgi:hypothetical protein
MIKRVVTLLATALTLSVAAPAWAWGPPTTPPGNGNGPGGGGSSSSSGPPQYGHVRNCPLYATASSFGMSCISGSGGVQARTVKEVLDGDDPPGCWDERISADDQVNKYGLADAPDGTSYYLHYCVTDLDLNAPVGSQRAMQLNVQILEIPNDAPPCPSPQPADRQGRCVMTLTQNQQQVVEMSELRGGQIPPIVIVPQPSTRVRTNQAVAYQNRGGAGETRTNVFQVGAVRMWAELTRFDIQPYGPSDERITCDGSVRVTDADTPNSMPSACWFTYPASSAEQADHVYPFRAEADWTVYVDAGLGPVVFARFQKYDDLRLPVYDVQTLVVH